jgi:Na+/H+ antiporter NhaC
MFISRRSGRSTRFTVWKVALLFLGAGIWVAGIMAENFQITAAAIIVVAIALLLGLAERREATPEHGEPDDEDPEESRD